MHKTLMVWRYTCIAGHLARGLLTAGLLFPVVSRSIRHWLIKGWCRGMLSILNVELIKRGGTIPRTGKGMIMVANHISWLDIHTINALQPARFVAKSEIGSWPVVGWLSKKVGTLFIRRDRRRHIATVNQGLSYALGMGDYIALFPESTTTDGSEVKPFHASLLQPAINAGVHVQPVAIRYLDRHGAVTLAPAFINNMSLGESLMQILRARRLKVEVTVLPPIHTAGKTRREVAALAREAITRVVIQEDPNRSPGTPGDLPGAPLSAGLSISSPYPATNTAG
jgi:1-acyl-sn-glycerol-3-phosphate acyltransferase